jgi:hypothetical protein
MDYQAFNSQQPQYGGFNVTSSAPSPQHALHPQAFQQPDQHFSYGQYPNNGQASFPGPATGGPQMHMMQQPMQAAGDMQRAATMHQAQAYSAAPYAQSQPSPSLSNNGQQPYAPPHAQHSPGTLPSNGQQQQHHLQQQQQPMSQQIKPEPAQAQTPVKAVPPSPVSPVAQARNQDRVTTLLEINSLLIKEVCDLQSQGKAGQVGQPADGKPEGDKPQPSKEYVE